MKCEHSNSDYKHFYFMYIACHNSDLYPVKLQSRDTCIQESNYGNKLIVLPKYEC